MSKKKISWVTPDYFLDVDIPIVPNLLDEYDIIWIILFPWRNNRYKEEDLSKYAKKAKTPKNSGGMRSMDQPVGAVRKI